MMRADTPASPVFMASPSCEERAVSVCDIASSLPRLRSISSESTSLRVSRKVRTCDCASSSAARDARSSAWDSASSSCITAIFLSAATSPALALGSSVRMSLRSAFAAVRVALATPNSEANAVDSLLDTFSASREAESSARSSAIACSDARAFKRASSNCSSSTSLVGGSLCRASSRLLPGSLVPTGDDGDSSTVPGDKPLAERAHYTCLVRALLIERLARNAQAVVQLADFVFLLLGSCDQGLNPIPMRGLPGKRMMGRTT
eukprot:scaffold108162_cov28-Tisochrysis_lutea.AAC.4